jgi:hypothetical protein
MPRFGRQRAPRLNNPPQGFLPPRWGVLGAVLRLGHAAVAASSLFNGLGGPRVGALEGLRRATQLHLNARNWRDSPVALAGVGASVLVVAAQYV